MENQYIKCPRCELNYILKKDKFCDVCKNEMKAGILEENDLDDFELEEGLELCPICKANYISEGETMCASCMEENADVSKDEDPDWRGFVDKADDNDEEMDLLPVEEDDEIDEELEGAFAKDLEQEFEDEDEDEEEVDDIEDDFNTSFDDEDDDEEDEEDNEDDVDDADYDDFDDDDDFPKKKRK